MELKKVNQPTCCGFPCEDNLADQLRAVVRRTPDKVGFFFVNRDMTAREVTYAQFFSDVKKAMTGLKAAGITKGDRVALQLPEWEDSVIACWACWCLGVVAMPLPIPDTYGEANVKLKKLEVACTMCEENKAVVITEFSKVAAIRNLRMNAIEGVSFPRSLKTLSISDLRDNEEDADTLTLAPNDLAALMLTSGSTGNPKAVMLSHGNLIQSHYDKARALKLQTTSRLFNWIACDHVVSICECSTLAICVGGVQGHIKAQYVIQDPLNLLRAVSKFKITQTFAPNFLFGLLVDKIKIMNNKDEKSIDLSGLNAIISGGEAVVVETAVELTNLMKKHFNFPGRIMAGFGMTETCAGHCWNYTFPNADDLKSKFSGLGFPMPRLQMRVVDDNGEELKAGEKGNLQLKGPGCFRGYFNNPSATQKCYPNGLDGWMSTGDLARIDPEFGLRLCGRTKDVVIINGNNFECEECESAVNKIPGVVKSFTAASPVRLDSMESEQYIIFYNSTRSLEDDGYLFKTFLRIRDECVQFVGIRPYAIICLPQDQIPKSTLGKVMRRKLRAAFERGDFAGQEQKVKDLLQKAAGELVPPETKAQERVLQAWSEVLGMASNEISIRVNFFDLGGTSLDTIALKAKLDVEFGFDIPAVWVFGFPTVEEFAQKVEDKLLMQDQLRNEDGSYNHEFANKMYDPVVRFHDSGNKRPIFAVHTGAGDVLAFVELAKRFQNDRPFYGVRTRGLNEGETYFSDFYVMVDSYCQGVMKKQPEGAYNIMGYSYGAVVAWEMVKMLEQKYKKEVVFCGVVDTPVELRGFGEIPILDLHVYLSVYLGLVPKSRYTTILAKIRECEDEKMWAPTMLANCVPSKVEELQMDVKAFQDILSLAHSFKSMAAQQNTQGRVRSMQVFSCFRAEPMMVPSSEWRRQQRMWTHHAHSIQFYNIRGHHETCVSPENVASFFKVFKAAVELAEIQYDERLLFKDMGGMPVDELEEQREGAEEQLFNHDKSTIATMARELTAEEMAANLHEV